MPCVAYRDRTGAYTCNRCGYAWDADDDAPDCKTWQQIKQEKQDRKHKEREAGKQYGRKALKHIREDLEK